MNRVIEATGKTVKDAIQNGLEQLGCTIDEVETSVIEMNSPGLFGLFSKPAKVRLTVKGEDHSLDIEMPVFSLDPSAGKRKPEKKQKVRSAEKSEAPKTAEPKTEASAETNAEPEIRTDKPHKSRSRRKEKPENTEPKSEPVTIAASAEPEEPFVATPEEEMTETARNARAFLKELSEKMGVPAEIAVCEKSDSLRMQLSGENMSILIGRRGETLDALQYLTSLNVNRGREEYMRVTLDTENYRAKREEALRKLAVRMANRAKKSGRRVALEPMNPNERRILHSALQNDPEVTTHSEGEEPYRRVIITLK